MRCVIAHWHGTPHIACSKLATLPPASPAARHLKRLSALARLDTQRQVALQLPLQPVLWGKKGQVNDTLAPVAKQRPPGAGYSALPRCLALRLRLVTNLPSWPAKGEVLTENVMRTVGSST